MALIYIGPSIGGLIRNSVFSNGIPSSLQETLNHYPAINVLLVQIEYSAAAYAAVQIPGTPEYEAYHTLEMVGTSSGAGSEMLPENVYGTINVTFHDSVSVPGDGKTLWINGQTTLLIETYGSSSSQRIEFKALGPSGVARELTGVRMKDLYPGSFSETIGEMWQFEITGMFGVFVRVASIFGGTLSVKGRALP